MATSGGRSSGGKTGKSGAGNASPAALFDDQETMERRRAAFCDWKKKRRPTVMIHYSKSPSPPSKRS